MVSRYPDIRARTLAIITIAGVNQGASPAEGGYRTLVKLTGSQTPTEALEKVRAGQARLEGLSPALAAVLALGAGSDLVQQILGGDTVSATDIVDRVTKALNVDQVRQGIEGIYDMTQYARLKWNLVHFNDKFFDQKINIFNLSVMTDRKDWATPAGVTNWSRPVPTTIFPQFKLTTPKAQINWKLASEDNAFLLATSLDGFDSAPAGLFDTQVAWTDTKSMLLDNRTIARTLYHPINKQARDPLVEADLERMSAQEIAALYVEVNADRAAAGLAPIPATFPNPKKGGRPLTFAEIPRSQLLKSLGTTENFNIVDLGDLRGTHWDISFREVYKPKDEAVYYTHTFPRKAFISALIETMAIYKSGLSNAAQEPNHVQ